MAHNNRDRTECRRGHPFTKENTYITKTGRRQCRRCCVLRSEACRQRDPDKVKRLARIRWALNPQKFRDATRQSRLKHIDTERERARNNNAKRRALKKEGSIPVGWHKTLMSLQRGLCLYCGTDLAQGYHLEHMLPLSKGGLHDHENTCLSCPTCNFRKRTESAEEFFARGA